MRKYFLILLLMIILTLVGCGEPKKPMGSFDNVTVDSKRQESRCNSCAKDYTVIVEKKGQKVEFVVKDVNLYNSLKEGTVINLTYNKYYEIESVFFVDFEEFVEEDLVEDNK